MSRGIVNLLNQRQNILCTDCISSWELVLNTTDILHNCISPYLIVLEVELLRLTPIVIISKLLSPCIAS